MAPVLGTYSRCLAQVCWLNEWLGGCGKTSKQIMTNCIFISWSQSGESQAPGLLPTVALTIPTRPKGSLCPSMLCRYLLLPELSPTAERREEWLFGIVASAASSASLPQSQDRPSSSSLFPVGLVLWRASLVPMWASIPQDKGGSTLGRGKLQSPSPFLQGGPCCSVRAGLSPRPVIARSSPQIGKVLKLSWTS